MLPGDYLNIAERLLSGLRGRPRQADLRRAISTAYYAVFYALCRNSADCFIGASGADRRGLAWRQVFRAIDHGVAKHRSMNRQAMLRFSPSIRAFAEHFESLQEERHKADYDPGIRFSLDEAQNSLDTAALAIAELGKASLKDRRAFAAYITVKDRP